MFTLFIVGTVANTANTYHIIVNCDLLFFYQDTSDSSGCGRGFLRSLSTYKGVSVTVNDKKSSSD